MTANLYPLPTPKPGHRFVPAKVGATNATSIICLIECPTFCVEDHVAEPVRHVEDIIHVSTAPGVATASFLQHGPHHQVWATVQTDPVAADPRLSSAHIVVEDQGGEYAHLTPEMAEAYADSLIGFASELRHLAREARLHNQANGDSDPDMDEALRRVRGGVA
ncbi:DUF6907 domain-containing protein [Streptomyces europaeiscabiei]|uniref:DUF6907 domain-containing protein n=1 Tax=Streptomyces europaeiscabiei TaxID=146819 RepID=UPI0029AD97D0|nr:hypothetical protein [Streptomyces europaeiscabiei]MDX2770654.1 hypothetical protein [Streptomyces europaeiscabiei]